MRAHMSSADLVGKSFAHYQILELIGEGGMGAVFRARDTHLDRDVAIKVLPAEVTSDADRVRRFEAEARTASSLNHPHLVSIYDVGPNYIAMELVDGMTLRELIDRERLPLKKALTYLTEVAEAVSAAHKAGIIHRDLKPENIVISRNGYAKVLDFGLAKLREPVTDPDSQATAVKLTDPGTILGTAAYMSPEQAQGLAVDHRSDIFSFGCILYECVTRKRPFGGASKIDTLHQIIHSTPASLSDIAPTLPQHLQWIVRKCLAKDPDDRYQTMRDVAIDLRELVSEIDSGAATPMVVPARRTVVWPWVAIALVAAIAAAFFWQSRRSAPVSAAAIDIRRLTLIGKVIEAAISPDGKYMAYVVSDQGKQTLWLRQVSGTQAVLIRPAEAAAFWGHTFTPDGDAIYYGLKSNETGRGGSLFRIATLGGPSKKILDGIDGGVAFSPDGAKMVWARDHYPTDLESALMIANADGSAERILLKRHAPDFFAGIFFSSPSWSAGGEWIIAPYRHVGTDAKGGVVAVHPDGSGERDISHGRWNRVGYVAWLPDSKRFLAVGERARGALDSAQIWSIPFESGDVQRITRDLADYRIVSLTRDGRDLLTVAAEAQTSVWRASLPGGTPVRITSEKYDGLSGLVAMPDGRVVFSSIASGESNLIVANADGADRHPLLAGGATRYDPAVSPDGSLLAYLTPLDAGPAASRVEQSVMLLKVEPAAGGAARTLTQAQAFSPAFTPDGKTLIFVSGPEGSPRLASVPVKGRSPTMLTGYDAYRPAVSPDGKSIACFCHLQSEQSTDLCVLPITGGAPTQRFPFTPSNTASVAWSVDGKRILFTSVVGDRSNIYAQPLDGSPREKLTNFSDQMAAAIAPARDGQNVFLARADIVRDAVLITGFQ